MKVPMFLLGFGAAMLLAAWNPLPVVAQSAELQPATSQEYDRYVANLEAELEAKGQITKNSLFSSSCTF